MRCLILLLFAAMWTSVHATLNPMEFPNMVLYHEDANDPYIEVYFAGNKKKLEATLLEGFSNKGVVPPSSKSDSLGLLISSIQSPIWWPGSYECQVMPRSGAKNRHLLHIRLKTTDGLVNLLDPKRGIFRDAMAFFQRHIDLTVGENYDFSSQRPGEVYVFIPKAGQENLYSYMFLYTKEHIDTVASFLAKTLVYECEVPQNGKWINDSTFRVDGLRQPALGYKGFFSLTIEYSLVDQGYGQYIIYLSNFEEGDIENNYTVRFHDLHMRLWRFYLARATTSGVFSR